MTDIAFTALGIALVLCSFADLVNTLISTSTSYHRFWPSRWIGRSTFVIIRALARRMPEESNRRERLLAGFGPLLVIELLLSWAVIQVIGFGMIWWRLDDISTIGNLGDAWYFSGVVFFTVGFGEIVPTETVPRIGALSEAFSGVITVALVIGYLPSLYSAYSDREKMLVTLDAGNKERISPDALVKAWAPDADPKKINDEFGRWVPWAAGILETHSTVPLLALFRSHDRKQNWVTGLGLLCDAALFAQIIVGATDGHGYWFLRRAEAIFREMTTHVDLDPYVEQFRESTDDQVFRGLYDDLLEHGFVLRPYEEARAYASETRLLYAPAMEYMIDDLLCPRGFWSTDSRIESFLTMYPEHEIEAVTSKRDQ